MNTKAIALFCAAAAALASGTTARAQTSDPAAVAADALIARPLCLVATIVGSAVFVVSLPVAATSGSVHSAAHTLVVTPAWATFKRPLGDFDYAANADDFAMAKHLKHRKAHRQASSPRSR